MVSRQFSRFFFLFTLNSNIERSSCSPDRTNAEKRNRETKFSLFFLLFVGKQKKSMLKKMKGHQNQKKWKASLNLIFISHGS
jgi:hypothetical protein